MWHIFCIMNLVFYRLIGFVLAASILLDMAWQIENNEGRAGGGGGGGPAGCRGRQRVHNLLAAEGFMTSWRPYRANNCKLSMGQTHCKFSRALMPGADGNALPAAQREQHLAECSWKLGRQEVRDGP